MGKSFQNPVFVVLLVVLMFYGSFLVFGSAAVAQGPKNDLELAVQNVGLLPTNPFYFIKEWSRSVRRTLIFDSVKKVNWELGVLQSKLAELKKLSLISGEEQIFAVAAENYLESLRRLRELLDNLRGRSPAFAVLLEKLVEQVIKHQQILDELAQRFKGNEASERLLKEIDVAFAEIMALVESQVDSKQFNEQFKKAVDQQKEVFKELKAAELIDRWENKFEADRKNNLLRLKEELLLRLSGYLESLYLTGATGTLPGLAVYAGDPWLRLRLLDELRERVVNADIKSDLTVIRQRFLEQSIKDGLTEKRATAVFKDAESFLNSLLEEISKREGAVSVAIRQLADRAAFHLNQALDLLEKGNYSNAVGQAGAGAAAAKNALGQLSVSESDFGEELSGLREKYDQLHSLAQSAGRLSDERLAALFGQSEKMIARVSKLINDGAKSDQILAGIRSAKLLLATIYGLLAQ